MFFVPQIATPQLRARKGVVLLVVIALLALFAAVGLSFVYYAESEAQAAAITVQANSPITSDINPEMLISFFLSQYIYDVDDQVQLNPPPPYSPSHHNIESALRGQSLARNMYGYNRYSLNVTPFNGVGRNSVTMTDPNVRDATGAAVPTNNLINFQYFKFDGRVDFNGDKIRDFYGPEGPTPLPPQVVGDFIRDPGWYGTQNRGG